MANKKIIIPLSASDIEDLMSGEEFNWTFPTKEGEEIDVLIRPEQDQDYETDIR